jgi:hypothetical protein
MDGDRGGIGQWNENRLRVIRVMAWWNGWNIVNPSSAIISPVGNIFGVKDTKGSSASIVAIQRRSIVPVVESINGHTPVGCISVTNAIAIVVILTDSTSPVVRSAGGIRGRGRSMTTSEQQHSTGNIGTWITNATPLFFYEMMEGMKMMEDMVDEEKELDEQIKAKMREILSKDLFIVDKQTVEQIIKCEYEYPNYNTPELKELLFRMAITTEAKIGETSYKDEEWDISLELWFATSPRQFKVIFQDRFEDYPFLFLIAKVGKQASFGTNYIVSQQPITLGRAVSLLRQFKFKWT